jgi:TRAP-type mannitol/chloroaromatic compound transport system substrate-binding protein
MPAGRRQFLGVAGAGLAGAVAAPAVHAQSRPEIHWRCVSSFPKSLETLYGGAEHIARRVATATQNRFQIQLFGPGEIVPGLQVLDAVQNETIECAETASTFFVGKDPTFAFDTALPFGLSTRHHNAWMTHGGGLELTREFLRDYGVLNFPCGNTGAQMGGWFRKEIRSVADLKGLKMRIAGLGGIIIARLGVVPQQLAGPDVYPALERGSLDAVEFSGPHDDEKLGFVKVARHYYYPSWWEYSAQVTFIVNVRQWEALPRDYQAILEAACAETNAWMLAKYDALNPAALRRLVAAGAVLHAFPAEVMEASYQAAFEYYDEVAAANAKFRRIYEAWMKFRADEFLWFRVAEHTMDNFLLAHPPAKPR